MACPAPSCPPAPGQASALLEPLGAFRVRGSCRLRVPTIAPHCNTESSVRYFNTEGPVESDQHYCIPPMERVESDEIVRRIERRNYFVFHGPRQTGKTSILLDLADRLNAGDSYRCVYINVEVAQTARADVGRAIANVFSQLALHAGRMLGDTSVDALRHEVLANEPPGSALTVLLARWCAADPKPLVLMIDEIDAMIGASLISVLRQLCAGHFMRPKRFPQSVILCGVRDVGEFRVSSAREQNYTGRGSAFNLKTESLRLGDFTEREMHVLLEQHTAETGQAFERTALERVWELTSGQPWLVNALAQETCFKDKAGRDRSRAISETAIDNAKETLFLERVTHLDQLVNQLAEDRVRRVIEPMLAGGRPRHSRTDRGYVRDLGLVARNGPVRIANPIYAEVIPRELTDKLQDYVGQDVGPFLDAGGRLRIMHLLVAFQEFFRQNSEHIVELISHKEAYAQLILQAFLQRVVNGGGRITRDYPLARRRTDLLIQWPQGGSWDSGKVNKHVIECKALRTGRGLDRTIEEGLRQTASYMDRSRAESGHLVVFDQRPEKSWDERIFRREAHAGETSITVWGM